MKHHIIVKWNNKVTDKKGMIPGIKEIFDKVLLIEGISAVELIDNVVDRPNRYDLMIRITMDKKSLSIYDASEAHKEWKKKYSEYIELKAIFDSEN